MASRRQRYIVQGSGFGVKGLGRNMRGSFPAESPKGDAVHSLIRP